MAYQLSRSYILGQLAAIGINQTQFDSMSQQDKVAALQAVALASLAGSDQSLVKARQAQIGAT